MYTTYKPNWNNLEDLECDLVPLQVLINVWKIDNQIYIPIDVMSPPDMYSILFSDVMRKVTIMACYLSLSYCA